LFRAISRDSNNYDSPEEFIPERFLDMETTKILDPRTYAFGFGRR
jgi:cytochrome P450